MRGQFGGPLHRRKDWATTVPNETIRGVRATYGRAASLALNLVAHDPVKSGNEIRNDKGPLSG